MDNERTVGRPTLLLAAAVALVVAVVMFVISDAPAPAPDGDPGPTETPPQAQPVVEFGVWGTEAELAAYERVVAAYNDTTVAVEAELVAWPSAEEMLADIDTGAASPDVFLLPRSDLASTVANSRNRPLLELLDARGVSLGDDYSRTAISAFSSNDALQCMPYTSSPMVMYYNTDLIDFEALAEQGVPVPREEDGRWTLEGFRAAAEAATRPRQRTRGFYVEPTLEDLAPFLVSGGGSLFDDDTDPTSLALGEDASVEAIKRTLAVLRDSALTLTQGQLNRRTPLEWFQNGQLGMLPGYRNLVPELRKTEGLNFDVLPMPSLGSTATIGDLTGLCIAEGELPEVERAADFLVHVINAESVAEVVATGSVTPSHLQVAFSDDFLQPDRQPERADAFTRNQRHIELMPLTDSWDELEEIAADGLDTLFTGGAVLTPQEIEEILGGIDEESRELLDPDYEPESDAETESDTDSS